ncbi:uncharacterized protein LOC143279541 [Babylonia areolata]|uniref:uncharacterized protein LOC143279541 n=1 Tax=Babylonia areolata TaxID=304850 RepID=UPI003FCFA38B
MTPCCAGNFVTGLVIAALLSVSIKGQWSPTGRGNADTSFLRDPFYSPDTYHLGQSQALNLKPDPALPLPPPLIGAKVTPTITTPPPPPSAHHNFPNNPTYPQVYNDPNPAPYTYTYQKNPNPFPVANTYQTNPNPISYTNTYINNPDPNPYSSTYQTNLNPFPYTNTYQDNNNNNPNLAPPAANTHYPSYYNFNPSLGAFTFDKNSNTYYQPNSGYPRYEYATVAPPFRPPLPTTTTTTTTPAPVTPERDADDVAGPVFHTLQPFDAPQQQVVPAWPFSPSAVQGVRSRSVYPALVPTVGGKPGLLEAVAAAQRHRGQKLQQQQQQQQQLLSSSALRRAFSSPLFLMMLMD